MSRVLRLLSGIIGVLRAPMLVAGVSVSRVFVPVVGFIVEGLHTSA